MFQKRTIPFLVRFSELIPPRDPIRLKYDESLQVSLVEINGQWVDSCSVVIGETRITKIKSETTDDA